jgi:hypothetical protein
MRAELSNDSEPDEEFAVGGVAEIAGCRQSVSVMKGTVDGIECSLACKAALQRYGPTV